MRSLLVLVCCCSALVLAEDKKVDDSMMKEVPLPDGGKPWATVLSSQIPTAQAFSANLAANPGKIRPEILAAHNLSAELDYWKQNGYPDVLEFLGDNNEPVVAQVTGVQPVLFANYIDGVKFHYFNKYDEKDIQGQRITDVASLMKMGWDVNLPVKIIIHGFINSIVSPAIQVMKNAYLKSGKYNVIGVDWGKLCGFPWYHAAVIHVPGTGAQVGEFIDKLITLKLTVPSNVHILGHSLGAHVAGIAGKSMVQGVPKRITGLDPAGPLFWVTDPPGIIYHSDAELVDVYHTNAGLLGKSAQLGDIDFYVNGGSHQPECKNDFSGSCSHSRSFEYFADTVVKGEGKSATWCPHLPKNADNCQKEKALYTAKSGNNLDFTRGGPYYLNTVPPKPIILPSFPDFGK